MTIKRTSLVFHNVIQTKNTSCKVDEWPLIARDLRNHVIKNGLYATGPVFYQVSHFNKEQHEAEYTFYVPVNAPVNIPENSQYQFTELLQYKDGLLFRLTDMEADIEIAYEFLKAAAQDLNLTLQEPFYNIYLDVYGEGIIDIFAPILGEDAHD
ncbi:DUF5085 family protein [Niallia sp. XMNu-256]|uniref:DUF5085 family protein n=1 Tax=Niallia sp. XMNu-256 TaxID=3082444 RepID=UPI0030CD6E73